MRSLLARLVLFAAILSATGARLPGEALHDKTLVAWVELSNLTQQGGSALTIQGSSERFDGIVFGELSPKRWMAGSDFWKRTEKAQDSWPEENSRGLVQIAVVYRGNEVILYRDGVEYARYTVQEQQAFGDDALVVIGPRHTLSSDFLSGSVSDARIYDTALAEKQIANLRPGKPSEPKPWAWWAFEKSPDELTGRFKATRLIGGIRIADGCLQLTGDRPSFIAARDLDALEAAGFPGPRPPPFDARENIPQDIEAARRLKNSLLSDPWRPGYHFVIPEGIANPFDPNGAIYWKGRCHLFYIYQENGVHCFGHVSSTDLIHWRQHPPALFPTGRSPERGIYSGNCFINKNGEATMLYHGLDAGNCIATSTDDELDHWTKLPSNPIVPNPGDDAPYKSWDPCGWLEGGKYYAVFGGHPGENPKPASVFTANELGKWSHVGPFLAKDMPDVSPDEDISCPDFFPLGGKRVLVCISHTRGARYYVGEWRNEQFHPESHARMSSADGEYFAPETVLAPDGRRILWAWLRDGRDEQTIQSSAWSGELALPRELRLGEDGLLEMRPLEKLKTLRYDEKYAKPREIPPHADLTLEGIGGSSIELEVEIDPGSAQEVGVKVCRSPSGEEETVISYTPADGLLKIDTTKSGVQGSRKVEAAPFRLKTGETLKLRIFVDRSIVEAFANARQAIARHTYPARPDSLGVAVFSQGGTARLLGATAWKMVPSNPY